MMSLMSKIHCFVCKGFLSRFPSQARVLNNLHLNYEEAHCEIPLKLSLFFSPLWVTRASKTILLQLVLKFLCDLLLEERIIIVERQAKYLARLYLNKAVL